MLSMGTLKMPVRGRSSMLGCNETLESGVVLSDMLLLRLPLLFVRFCLSLFSLDTTMFLDGVGSRSAAIVALG